MSGALIQLSGLTKSYPGVRANDGVSLEIAPGEIHALLGENGAGKSTLVKMIYGLVKPDAGDMVLEGRAFAPTEPRAARAAGIAMVFQHFSLFDALSVAENIALGMEDPPALNTLSEQIAEVSERYGLPLNPDASVGGLSAGERQRVEIIRCLLQDPKLLIMDEPTSVLTPQEVDILFATLRQLSAAGTSILYISHKLEEIRALCDAATILRGGKVVAECDPKATSAQDMAEQMVGTEFSAPQAKAAMRGAIMLQINALSMPAASAFGMPLRDISLSVNRGEVLGIGGVAGNGQDELLAVLSGERRTPRKTLIFKETDISTSGPRARRRLGLLTAPEERLGHAAAPDMSLTENVLLTGGERKSLEKLGFLDWSGARSFAADIISRFDVRTPGTDTAARALSGGNLQKFVIGREILQDPDLLVVNQPTWGVDAAAAAAIRQALLDLVSRGAAVIVISQDLDELMQIAHRFCALSEGRLSAPQPTSDLTLERIGMMLGGAHGMEAAHV